MSQINRRDFIKVMGVSSTTALVACDPTVPLENVLPYVIQPDQIVPGLSTWFATKCNECSAGCGVVARNREGRVVKLEGNDVHPTNQGKLCARGQAGILGTYSPDRFTGPMAAGKSTDWETAHKTLSDGIVSARTAGKDVVWIGSPKTAATDALIQQFIAASGGKVLYWDPIEPPGLRAATAAVFGRTGMPRFVLDQAHTILSFGADFLGTWGSQVEHSLGYANSRDPEKGGFVSRLVCVEPRVGTTSAMADLHLAPVPGTEAGLAMAMAKLLADSVGYKGAALSLVNDVNVRDLIEVSGISEERVKEVVHLLAEAPSAVLPGGVGTSAAVSELATAVLILNEVAGNIGKSVVFGPEHKTDSRASYNDVVKLLAECAAGKVGVLLMDGLDLAHLLPTDLNTKTSLSKVDLFVAFENEPTDSLTENALVLPTGSTLETWGDGEEVAGRYTLQQPAMNPLHDTKSASETLLAVAKLAGLKAVVAPADEENAEADPKAPETESEDGTEAPTVVAAPVPGLDAASHVAYIKGWWEATVWPAMGQTGTMANFWTQCQQQGGAFVDIAVETPSIILGALPATAGEAPSGDGLILTLFPHPFIMDGRHANKPWAQEVPEPLSSYTWGTWIEIHPETADQLGLTAEHGVTVSTPQGQIEAGWFGSPGIRKDTIAVVMGNGHTNSGRYTRFGSNPITLLASKADGENFAYVATRATVRRSASTINNHAYLGSLTMEGRGINFTVSKDDLGTGHGAGSIVPAHHVPVDKRLTDNGLNDMYPEPTHPTYRFAMTVDLNRCTGCGSCETACYAENNIAIVGPDQIKKARHMGWIRLSRYWQGEGEHPDVRFQPTMCQQCSHAPCESVCPVLATYHNLDGLNAMIYNRCVGTRYCANNCPYTARRFNWHTYQWPESFNLMLNPDLSTREMGVMEKCTFCIQRVREAKDLARDDGTTVAEETLLKLTACAQACPADAITCGNLKDTEGQVAKQFESERAYAMLSELNTKPGVRYLARITHTESNAGGHESGGGHH